MASEQGKTKHNHRAAYQFHADCERCLQIQEERQEQVAAATAAQTQIVPQPQAPPDGWVLSPAQLAELEAAAGIVTATALTYAPIIEQPAPAPAPERRQVRVFPDLSQLADLENIGGSEVREVREMETTERHRPAGGYTPEERAAMMQPAPPPPSSPRYQPPVPTPAEEVEEIPTFTRDSQMGGYRAQIPTGGVVIDIQIKVTPVQQDAAEDLPPSIYGQMDPGGARRYSSKPTFGDPALEPTPAPVVASFHITPCWVCGERHRIADCPHLPQARSASNRSAANIDRMILEQQQEEEEWNRGNRGN